MLTQGVLSSVTGVSNIYANGVLTDIGVLGNTRPSDSLGTSVAYGLNSRDDVVAQSVTKAASPEASTTPGRS